MNEPKQRKRNRNKEKGIKINRTRRKIGKHINWTPSKKAKN
jgi:hypothetical protein